VIGVLEQRPPRHSRNPDWYRARYQLAALYLNKASPTEKEQLSAAQRRADELKAVKETREVARVTAEAADEFADRASESRRLRFRIGAEASGVAERDTELAEFLSTTIVPSALMLLAGALLFRVDLREEGTSPAKDLKELKSHKDIADALRDNLVDDPSTLVAFVEKQEELAPRVLYNLACYYTRIEELKKAAKWLEMAVLQTPVSERRALLEVVAKDPTLDPLEDDEELMREIARYLPRRAAPPASRS
jgi:hypothetical protein